MTVLLTVVCVLGGGLLGASGSGEHEIAQFMGAVFGGLAGGLVGRVLGAVVHLIRG